MGWMGRLLLTGKELQEEKIPVLIRNHRLGSRAMEHCANSSKLSTFCLLTLEDLWIEENRLALRRVELGHCTQLAM
jgi:hypothetical protein